MQSDAIEPIAYFVHNSRLSMHSRGPEMLLSDDLDLIQIFFVRHADEIYGIDEGTATFHTFGRKRVAELPNPAVPFGDKLYCFCVPLDDGWMVIQAPKVAAQDPGRIPVDYRPPILELLTQTYGE